MPKKPERIDRSYRSEVAAEANHLARLATQALKAEANLTPKPGLVDRRGSGAHADLTLEIMHRSAEAIEPYFREMAEVAHGATANLAVFNDLKALGQLAEQSMLSATNGSNAHKGAIWSLGLLVSAASMHESVYKPRKAFAVAATAGTLAKQQRLEDRHLITHGMIVSRRYHVAGALGEAQAGFPHVIGTALPVLRRSRDSGDREEIAQLNALLALMSEVDDTCILYRGGAAALHDTKRAARSALADGGAGTSSGRQRLLDLDRSLIKTNCSPGGSADLLAATIFLDALERRIADIAPVGSHVVLNKEI